MTVQVKRGKSTGIYHKRIIKGLEHYEKQIRNFENGRLAFAFGFPSISLVELLKRIEEKAERILEKHGIGETLSIKLGDDSEDETLGEVLDACATFSLLDKMRVALWREDPEKYPLSEDVVPPPPEVFPHPPVQTAADIALHLGILAERMHVRPFEGFTETGKKTKAGRSKAGKNTTNKRRAIAKIRDPKIVEMAKELQSKNTNDHDLVGILERKLALEDDKSSRLSGKTIRTILQKGGLLKKRKNA